MSDLPAGRAAVAAPAEPPALPTGGLPELSTANSTTRRNDDGSLTTSVSAGLVNFRDPQGRWMPIDSSLVDSARPGYSKKNKANSFTAEFKDSSEGSFLRLEIAGEPFLLSALDGLPGKASSRGSHLAYSSAFPNADIRYDVREDGVKETIVLKNRSAPSEYRFELTPPAGTNVDVAARPDGSWGFSMDPIPGTAFVMEAPRAVDSAPANQSGDDPDGHSTMSIVRDGDVFAITVTVDEAWLNSPERTFPILLDPTITIQPDVKDANFSFSSPGSLAWATSDRVYMGSSSTNTWRGALQFDVSSVPANAIVSDAKLGLYYDGYCMSTSGGPFCGGTAHQLDAHRMTAAWSTTSTASQLAFDAAPAASYTLPVSASSRWMDWGITNTVRDWVTGAQPNNGLLMKRATEALASSGPTPPGLRGTEPTVRPKLDITYTSDGVDLDAPETLHANGADLRWTRYVGPSGAPFDRYEVHRSSAASFTPSTTTLLATIRDIATTTYRDTTAAPNASFTYKVVANTTASNARTVTLPANGQASKVLQPDPTVARDTYLYRSASSTNCANYGAETRLFLGTTANNIYRPTLHFDVRDIPASAIITNATLSVWQQSSGPTNATTTQVHRLTQDWAEGTGTAEDGNAECTKDGATWYDASGALKWSTEGGDIDPAPAATFAKPAGDPSGWDDFNITSLVGQWSAGQTANNGIALKLSDETLVAGNYATYNSGDFSAAASLRPKLAVTYADGSYAQAPVTNLSQPAAGRVSGAVPLAAGATDDRRVERVDFLVDGAVIATDSAAPYTATWTSSTATNGSHNVAARATDDAGNITTSAPTAVSVDNTAAPTASVTAPAANATVAGTAVVINANATDDRGVTKVEFFVDDQRVGEDTATPFTTTWNTLAAAQPYFDGAHTITSKTTDDSGQVTTSAAVNVTVSNIGTTKYKGAITPTAAPQAVNYDPALGTQETSGFSVTVKNNSTTLWRNADVKLYYQWYAPDWIPGAAATITGPPIALGADMKAAATRTITGIQVPAPALPAGTDRAQWKLRFDLYDTPTATFFAAKGNAPADNPINVTKVSAVALGLERWLHYEGAEVGAGMQHLVNVSSGNSLLRWSPFSAPGRGLSTVVDLTYNSLEQHSESPAGNNFSLSVSSLTRFGNPLDIHPNNSDTAAGRSAKWMRFTDGDGTTFRFDAKTNATTGKTYWEEPAGVHLYLREYSTLVTTPKKWALTRPDRVTYFYDQDGYPTSGEDANANVISFTYENTPAGDDPGGPKKRITAITDAAGQGTTPAPNRVFRITYFAKADAPKARIRGKVKTITDHNGTALDFAYYEDGNLLRLTQKGGAKADGSALADRSFVFTYTTSSGDAAAITDPALRADPNSRTSNQSARLYSVRDPLGRETLFTYHGPTSGALRWKLASRTDRTGARTDYSYDLAASRTTATAPLTRVSKYVWDSTGRPTTITNPANQDTGITWTADNAPIRITEPTGKYMEYAYNANGYLTDTWDQLRNRTTLAYTAIAVDTTDVAGHWKAGRTIGHISQIATKTEPKGTATATPTDDYQWAFTHDPKGNLTAVSDQADKDTLYSYNADGTLATTTDANARITRVTAYDANGLPATIVDAKNQTTKVAYDDDGNVVSFQDPRHQNDTGPNPAEYQSRFLYDSWGRLGAQSAPKSTAYQRGELIWTGADYDANDNLTLQVGPHYAATYTAAGARTTTSFDAMDRPLVVTGPDTTVDPAGERTVTSYDTAGRPAAVTSPRGTLSAHPDDFTETRTYDALDRVIRATRREIDPATGALVNTLNTHSCYDLAGDLRSTTAPKAGLATVDCTPEITAGATPATPFTARYTYDDAHRRLTAKDPLGYATSTGYDANSNVTTTTDENTTATAIEYDLRDKAVKVTEPITTGGTPRNATTRIDYDPVGNRSKVVSPRGWDASADKLSFTDYVTSYVYDELDRLTRTDLPADATTPQRYIHNAYDPNGNLAWVSYPTAATTAAGVVESKKTSYTHFDPGWNRTSSEPCFTDTCSDNLHVNPALHFDYTAEGWQTVREPESSRLAGSTINSAQQERQNYFVDGKLRERTDAAGLKTTFAYDADNNQTNALSNEGVTAASESGLEIQSTFDTLNRLAKVRQKKQAEPAWKATIYAFDLNGNVNHREDDATEGSPAAPIHKHDFAYDDADRVTRHDDYGPTSVLADDQVVTTTYAPTDWPLTERVEAKDAAGALQRRQLTETTYLANGLVATKATKTGAADVAVESHTVSYEAGGKYLNGNRSTDTYTRAAATGETSPCSATACVQAWTYDARDRLTLENDGHGTTSGFTLDDASNITAEAVNGATTRRYGYNGGSNVLATVQDPAGNVLTKTYYTDRGNIDCVTSAAAAGHEDCRPDSAGNTKPTVLASYQHDYRDRLESTRSFSGGTEQAKATYTYDALDRTTTSSEVHAVGAAPIDKRLTYVGITSDVTKEDHTQNGLPKTTKTFSYDDAGKRYAMTETPASGGTGTKAYTYGHDVHGSVTQLLDDAGAAKATYGYRAYGDADASSTKGDSSTTDPTNPYQFTAKRFDTGSGTYDMGARRYSPDVKRFLELDRYKDAFDDSGLATDPLTQNRYGFTGGNPVNYVEVDGHHAVKKSNKKYAFTYTWNWKSLKVPAADVMAAIRANPLRFFPFPIKCGAAVAPGVSCNVKPLPGASDWVDVLSASDRSFTFKARGGHIEGKGATITFTTSNDRNGGLIFKVHAHGPQSSNIVARTFMRMSRSAVAPNVWRGMAVNIFCQYKGGCGTPSRAF